MPAWLEYVNIVAGFVGLVITAVTLWRVQAVRRAQSQERALVRGLYGTDALAAQLRAAAG
jgi:L-lactate permease